MVIGTIIERTLETVGTERRVYLTLRGAGVQAKPPRGGEN